MQRKRVISLKKLIEKHYTDPNTRKWKLVGLVDAKGERIHLHNEADVIIQEMSEDEDDPSTWDDKAKEIWK